MKLLRISLLAAALIMAPGLRAETTATSSNDETAIQSDEDSQLSVEELDEQGLVEEEANPNEMMDATVLDQLLYPDSVIRDDDADIDEDEAVMSTDENSSLDMLKVPHKGGHHKGNKIKKGHNGNKIKKGHKGGGYYGGHHKGGHHNGGHHNGGVKIIVHVNGHKYWRLGDWWWWWNGYWYNYPYNGSKGKMLSCFAKNGGGTVFRAKARNIGAKKLQKIAINKCRKNSFHPYTCKAMGCHI
jgi:hypothetical protein